MKLIGLIVFKIMVLKPMNSFVGDEKKATVLKGINDPADLFIWVKKSKFVFKAKDFFGLISGATRTVLNAVIILT